MPVEKCCFGDFEFDVERNILLKHGQPVSLGQRALALLSSLLRANGKAVSKADLMEAAWPGEYVEESNLTVQISALRKCLGRPADGDEWIATVQRSGYQFVGTLSRNAVIKRGDLSSVDDPVTLAVLPFDNMDSDPEQVFFADGLTEDLITDLSRVSGLLVTSKHSSFAIRSRGDDKSVAGTLLGVRYLVDGSVRRAQGRVRITVCLINTSDNANVWAERYDRDFADIFQLQEDVASSIASAIKGAVGVSMSRTRYRSTSLEAYDLVVASRRLIDQSRPANREAHANLKRAVELDPNYPEAYYLLGINELLFWLLWDGDKESSRSKALHYAEMAEALDPGDPETFELKGFAHIKHGNYPESMEAFQKALAIDPNFSKVHAAIADWHFAMGNRKEALASAERAVSLEAFAPGWYFEHLGRIQLFNGMVEEAIATLRRPETYGMFSGRSLAAALASAGRVDEAREEARLFMLRQPHWRIRDWIETEFFAHKEDAELWFRLYESAGLPP